MMYPRESGVAQPAEGPRAGLRAKQVVQQLLAWPEPPVRESVQLDQMREATTSERRSPALSPSSTMGSQAAAESSRIRPRCTRS